MTGYEKSQLSVNDGMSLSAYASLMYVTKNRMVNSLILNMGIFDQIISPAATRLIN